MHLVPTNLQISVRAIERILPSSSIEFKSPFYNLIYSLIYYSIHYINLLHYSLSSLVRFVF